MQVFRNTNAEMQMIESLCASADFRSMSRDRLCVENMFSISIQRTA